MGFMDDGVYGFEYGIKLRKTFFSGENLVIFKDIVT